MRSQRFFLIFLIFCFCYQRAIDEPIRASSKRWSAWKARFSSAKVRLRESQLLVKSCRKHGSPLSGYWKPLFQCRNRSSVESPHSPAALNERWGVDADNPWRTIGHAGVRVDAGENCTALRCRASRTSWVMSSRVACPGTWECFQAQEIKDRAPQNERCFPLATVRRDTSSVLHLFFSLFTFFFLFSWRQTTLEWTRGSAQARSGGPKRSLPFLGVVKKLWQ